MDVLTRDTPIMRFSVSPQRPSLSSQLRRNALVDNRSALRRLAADCGLSDMAVFGSTGRGNAGPDSDIDLLVSVSQPDLLKLAHFQREAQKLLGYAVDVVPRDRLKDHVAQTIDPQEVFAL